MIFLAKLAKETLSDVQQGFNTLKAKGEEVNKFNKSATMKNSQQKEMSSMENLKKDMWNNHPKIMDMVREDKNLLALEDKLDTVKEFFEEKKQLKDSRI